ncbi:MAG: acyltransferase family protein [Rikenellaceae bacterium]
MNNSITTKQRSVWIDLVKVIAIFMMIAVHCTDNVTPAERSEPWYNLWGSIYGSFMRPAIPLFVMVTGILLLPIKMEITQFYRKRVLRVVVPFLVWSVIYNLFPWITGLFGINPAIINEFFAWVTPSQELGDALYNIAMIPLTFSYFAVQMWYVFLLIGIYLYLPFFSAWVKSSTKKEQHIFLFIWFISLFIPYLRQYVVSDLWGVCSWNEFGMLYSFAGFNGYLLLGYYLNENPIKWSSAKMILVFVPMFVIGYLVTFFGFKSITAMPGASVELVELFYTYCTPNVLMLTLPIFVFVQRVNIKSIGVKNVLKSLSVSTFGIWMSHYLFLGPCYMLVESLEIHTMLKMILCSVMLLTVTWLFVAQILKIKKIGKWIMG